MNFLCFSSTFILSFVVNSFCSSQQPNEDKTPNVIGFDSTIREDFNSEQKMKSADSNTFRLALSSSIGWWAVFWFTEWAPLLCSEPCRASPCTTFKSVWPSTKVYEPPIYSSRTPSWQRWASATFKRPTWRSCRTLLPTNLGYPSTLDFPMTGALSLLSARWLCILKSNSTSRGRLSALHKWLWKCSFPIKYAHTFECQSSGIMTFYLPTYF
jgi:hypothetical protein